MTAHKKANKKEQKFGIDSAFLRKTSHHPCLFDSPTAPNTTTTMLRLVASGRRVRGSSGLRRTACRVSFSSTTNPSNPKGTPYKDLTVGIPKENFPLEKRVAATPESVKRLVKPGFSVLVEDGAGDKSFFSNADYEAAGATIVPSSADEAVWKQSDIILKLRPPSEEQVDLLDGSKTLFSFLYPRQNEAMLKQLQDKGTTAFAMDMIPRTLSRGQTYDALSVSSERKSSETIGRANAASRIASADSKMWNYYDLTNLFFISL